MASSAPGSPLMASGSKSGPSHPAPPPRSRSRVRLNSPRRLLRTASSGMAIWPGRPEGDGLNRARIAPWWGWSVRCGGRTSLSWSGLLDRASGERVIDHRRVIMVVMADRPHDRVLVSQPREARKMLADVKPGNARGDRLEGSANLGGRLGLEVPHVQVRRPAQKVDEDARAGRLPRDAVACSFSVQPPWPSRTIRPA